MAQALKFIMAFNSKHDAILQNRYNFLPEVIDFSHGWRQAENTEHMVILGMNSDIEKRCFTATSSLIGWTHNQHGPCHGSQD